MLSVTTNIQRIRKKKKNIQRFVSTLRDTRCRNHAPMSIGSGRCSLPWHLLVSSMLLPLNLSKRGLDSKLEMWLNWFIRHVVVLPLPKQQEISSSGKAMRQRFTFLVKRWTRDTYKRISKEGTLFGCFSNKTFSTRLASSGSPLCQSAGTLIPSYNLAVTSLPACSNLAIQEQGKSWYQIKKAFKLPHPARFGNYVKQDLAK